jgi:hypothetical protein
VNSPEERGDEPTAQTKERTPTRVRMRTILLPQVRGQFHCQEAVMVIHCKMAMMMRMKRMMRIMRMMRMRMMNPLTPKWGKPRMNSLKMWTMLGQPILQATDPTWQVHGEDVPPLL